MATEKRFNIKLADVSREEFLAMCHKVLEESSTASVNTFLSLGISFNSLNVGTDIGDMYLTDSESYRELTQETFIDLWEKGLIYESAHVVNFCPGCQTTIADSEIEYQELPTEFVDVVFKVKETGEDIIISTTRPELICTCGMVIYNPADDRYKHLEGKTALTPLYNREVMIKSHSMAEMEKGTGLVMMCSIGDTSDIRFFREMGLEMIIAIDKDGRMNEHGGFLKGLKVSEARAEIIRRLESENCLVAKRRIMHKTPVCERSKDPIEFISLPELYLKQLEFKDDMRKIAYQLTFYDESSRQILLDWIDSITTDWPISRRRYYATEIPLWYCMSCGTPILPPKGKYYRPWKENPPIDKCNKCGGTKFKGEERVFDTWFDSSNSPLYILKYLRDPEFFEKNFPCTLRPQGKEIIRTWLHYSLLKSYLLLGKCIFKETWINYHIVDEKGYRMSKSKGNVIDPMEIIEECGGEAFRLWCAVEGNLTKGDFRCSIDRIKGASKTLTKLWNISRFVSIFEPPKDYELSDLDKWIINELNELIKICRDNYRKYEFHEPAIHIKTFIRETFSSHYIELVKRRAYNENRTFSISEQNGAIYTLHYCLHTILKLLAPIIPLFTYKVYYELTSQNIHNTEFPEPKDKYEIPFTTTDICNFNKQIWKTKKDNNLSLKSQINKVVIPFKFKSIEKEIRGAHNIIELEFANTDKDKIEIIL